MRVSRFMLYMVLFLITSAPASDINGQVTQEPKDHPPQILRKPMNHQGLLLAKRRGQNSRGPHDRTKAAGGDRAPDYRYPRIPPKPEPTPWGRLKAWFSHNIHVPPEVILMSPGFISLMTLLSFGIVYFFVIRR